MIFSVMEAQDAAIIIAASGALMVSLLVPLLKALSDIRKQTSETNVAVNNRPKADGTLRDVVDGIADRIVALEEKTERYHLSNSHRIDRATIAIEAQTRKMDRLASAIAGTNDRIDQIEEIRQEERREEHTDE